MSTASAFIEMAAESGGTTPPNSQQHFDVLPANPLTTSFDECFSRGVWRKTTFFSPQSGVIFLCTPKELVSMRKPAA